MSKHNPFGAAINCLSVMADKDFANGAPHRGSCRAAIKVLEAAAKIDKAKTIKDLDGYFMYLASHGFNEPNPRISLLMTFLASRPDEKEEGKK